jgi:hypothetical protein
LRSCRVSEYKAHEQDGKASIDSHSDLPCTTLGVRAEPNSLIGMMGAWKAACEVMCCLGQGVLFSSALAPVPSGV